MLHLGTFSTLVEYRLSKIMQVKSVTLPHRGLSSPPATVVSYEMVQPGSERPLASFELGKRYCESTLHSTKTFFSTIHTFPIRRHWTLMQLQGYFTISKVNIIVGEGLFTFLILRVITLLLNFNNDCMVLRLTIFVKKFSLLTFQHVDLRQPLENICL